MGAIRGSKAERTIAQKQLRQAVYGVMRESGLSERRMGQRLHMSEATFRRRMQEPGDFRLCELWRLAAEMGWTGDDASRYLF